MTTTALNRCFAFVTVCALVSPANLRLAAGGEAPQVATSRLRIVVIAGEDGVNIIQQKTAVAPLVEVRDENDQPVAGVLVRFAVRSQRGNAVRGLSSLSATTDAAGRATVPAFAPSSAGPLQIDVTAINGSQTATATINQTTYESAADATRARRNRPGNQGTNAANGTAAGAGAAGAAGAAAATSSGGGVSGWLIGGLVVGAAGAGAAVAVSQQKSDQPQAAVSAVTASTTSGLQSATAFAFSAQTSNFDQSSVQYLWEFGDGGTSTQAAPTHVYATAGTYAVAVTVRDARRSATSSLSVTVRSLSGGWTSTGGRVSLQLNQSGTSISGVASFDEWSQCSITGAVQSISPTIVLNQAACPHPVYAPLIHMEYRLEMSADGQSMSGTFTQGPGTRVEITNPVGFRR